MNNMNIKLTDENFVIDGMDGSGKETQADIITTILADLGHPFKKVSFPNYDNYTGALVKDYLMNSKSVGKNMEAVKFDSLLYTTNRLQTLTDMNYVSGENGFIFDRYTTSNMLFQTIDMITTDKEDYLAWLTELEYEVLKLPRPTKIIALRCSPSTSFANIVKRGRESDFFESIKVQNKIRENINYFEKYHGWHVVDVDEGEHMKSREQISSEIINIIMN